MKTALFAAFGVYQKGDDNGRPSERHYSIYLRGNKHERLLAIQTLPVVKYWFKDQEVPLETLIQLLESAPPDQPERGR